MERKYGMTNNVGYEPRVFFREHRSAQDIIKESFTVEFTPYKDDAFDADLFDFELDTGSGCGETCEIGADE
jgi:hypothetical protein